MNMNIVERKIIVVEVLLTNEFINFFHLTLIFHKTF